MVRGVYFTELKESKIALALLDEGRHPSRTDKNDRSLHRFILTYIEGDVRAYLISVYDRVIAAVATHSTVRDHALPCSTLSDTGIDQVNATESTGYMFLQETRPAYRLFFSPPFVTQPSTTYISSTQLHSCARRRSVQHYINERQHEDERGVHCSSNGTSDNDQ